MRIPPVKATIASRRKGRLGVRVCGTGSFVPKKVLTNSDLEEMVDTTDEWVYERTGIRERRVLENGKGTVEMAFHASRRALNSSRTMAADLDLIVMGTVTPNYIMPSGACLLQEKLKNKTAFAFDISAACSGFLYALVTAERFLSGGKFRKALVVGTDALTRFTDYTDRGTCILFGDGAGAAVLEDGGDSSGILSWRLYSDGAGWDKLYIPGGGSLYPASPKTLKDKMHYIKMKGRDIFKIAVKTMVEVSLETIEDAGWTIDDIDLFIPHQANRRIIEEVSRRLGLNEERVFLNIAEYGNTSAASIPIALDEAVRSGRIKRGDLLLMSSFGAGFTWGAILMRW